MRVPGLFVGPGARWRAGAWSTLPTPLAAGEGGPAIAQNPLSAARCSALRPCHPHSGRTDHFFFFFKSQGRGSASPRTSCLYISPFTGEYPAPVADTGLTRVLAGPGSPLLPVRGARPASGTDTQCSLTRCLGPCRSRRQGCKAGGWGRPY